jgi:hypothetical protein
LIAISTFDRAKLNAFDEMPLAEDEHKEHRQNHDAGYTIKIARRVG